MSSERVRKAVPVCEVCWIQKHAKWEPESVDDYGNIKMRFKSVTTPDLISTGMVDICDDCEKVTIAGIYEMREPKVTYGEDTTDYSNYTGFSTVSEEEEEEEDL